MGLGRGQGTIFQILVFNSNFCLSYFLSAVKKHPNKQRRAKRFIIWLMAEGIQSVRAGEAWRQELQADWPHCISTQEAGSDRKWCQAIKPQGPSSVIYFLQPKRHLPKAPQIPPSATNWGPSVHTCESLGDVFKPQEALSGE